MYQSNNNFPNTILVPRHRLRLTEGTVPSNGRAEIFQGDEWKSICSTKYVTILTNCYFVNNIVQHIIF